MRRKAVLVCGVAVAGAVGVYWASGLRVTLDGSGMWPRFLSTAPDYDALEADRAEQRRRVLAASAPVLDAVRTSPPPAADAAAPTPAPAVAVSNDRPAEPADPTTTSGRAEWPDFRGPNRDGHYQGPAIRTDWPEAGLPLLWKQPIGLGYASFVVANGLAFTIEQRRNQEVAAAYDVETGREVWTHGWDGEFVEIDGRRWSSRDADLP